MDTCSNFLYLDLNAVDTASYVLCAILTLAESTKETWTKGMDSLKEKFDDYMNIIST